jgi:pyruvate, water dikinase
MKTTAGELLLDLDQVGIDDIDLVGGKNASLGEMIRNLGQLGVQVPGGFIVTVQAYREFIAHNNFASSIKSIISSIDTNDINSLRKGGLQVRTMIAKGEFPSDLTAEILEKYKALSKQHGVENVDVAVRSSATAEDLPDASFAGQQDTFLNISTPESLLNAVRNCFASLFTDRAISYRETFNFDHFQIGLSVCVQKMVRSDLAASGVAFSLDTESGFRDVVLINASYGLGEMIVQGSISPDEFLVFKPALKKGFASIIEKKRGSKESRMIYSKQTDERVEIIGNSKADQDRFCINDSIVLQLAKWVSLIEDYYTDIKKHWCPMDVEWAVDGITGQLYIVQARPETIHSRKRSDIFTEYVIEDNSRHEKVALKGIAVGDKIGVGKVSILEAMDKTEVQHIHFTKGDVLVTDMTDPDWEPIMKKASAIITNKGGRTCHAAIVAREMGIPAIVGCGNATSILKAGETVTVSCAEGDAGVVYNGAISFRRQEFNIKELPEIKTPVMLNVASPGMAFTFANLPCKGVGLAREEFIINNYIQVHPLALLHHKSLNDHKLSERIAEITRGFTSGEEFFVEKLSFGIAKIAAAFYPHKVIVRFSDFKSNEYFNLLGGSHFEPIEENPMIGWRGASRYYSAAYKEAFGLECKAIRKVRNTMGLSNVVVMIPFCRTVKELKRVYDTMSEFGLKRKEDGLEVYLMAELPSNILMADEFAQHIDGFSIGSNDLTQLVLGLDRDSSIVAHLYDERNEAVKSMISSVIASAKKASVKVGICGQGPSDFPDFCQFLVEEGIDTISVTPDSFFKTVKSIHQIETQPVEKVEDTVQTRA